MNGRLFLGTARYLRDSGSSEANYRSAISRAYYACFLVIRDLALQPLNSVNPYIPHPELQKYLKNASIKEIQQLGQDLASLHVDRKDADYNMSQTISADDANSAVMDAEYILNSLAQIPKKDIWQTMAPFFQTQTGKNRP